MRAPPPVPTPTPRPHAAAAANAPSPLQLQVLDFVRSGRGHGVVEATAGSGKTTTLVQVARILPETEPACFLAFNRATAAELGARLPPHVEATTLHALGRAALLAASPRTARSGPDATKYSSLARGLVEARAPELGVPAELADYLARLAHVARLALAEPTNPSALAALAERFGLESPVAAARVPELHALLEPLLELGRRAAVEGRVDFTDMLHLPVVMGVEMPAYAFVCVDEAQDLSPAALALVMRLVEGGARALFVGDPYQAIYGFAGADRLSLERIVDTTAATVLPLSVSYRCPRRHVLLARRFSPGMEARPGAGAGRVRLLGVGALARLAEPGDLLMSRVNAPLVGLCLRLAGAGIPVRVLGVDLATPVLELAERLFGKSLPAGAEELVAGHARRETLRLERALLTDPSLPAALRSSEQRHRALTLLLRRLKGEGAHDLAALERLARRLLVTPAEESDTASDPNGTTEVVPHVVLSTIHKAKGREATRVFLLYPEELAPVPTGVAPSGAKGGPSAPVAQEDEGTSAGLIDEEAEANVLFVALTRAKEELVLVERRRGALAARLARPSRGGKAADLHRRWSDVLSLASTMAREERRSRLPFRARGPTARRRR